MSFIRVRYGCGHDYWIPSVRALVDIEEEERFSSQCPACESACLCGQAVPREQY